MATHSDMTGGKGQGASIVAVSLVFLVMIALVNGIGFWLGLIYGNQVPLGTAIRHSIDILIFMVQTPQYVAAWFEQSWGFLWLVAGALELILPFIVLRLMKHKTPVLAGVSCALAASLPDLIPMALDKMTGLLWSGLLISAVIYIVSFSLAKAKL
ncbi:hypothetical protein JCM17844_03190 [Iodidimonas gelatinilytica]|uniref:Uncharacterized protein n=1 Tax=Iodidimonas gelatinilytica TaxID=1236966 RepID=A0A5A7N121_9PROT|nr:hypothetical protein [Iodidimonas gelatinilytica]GEQ96682.1 hypothetical protein JCM17844_03190 [Iodidimonas gelatinilytica]GER01405.1 hypothetical protein JCM17845_20280 [Iodidimonas gelatinilytica]